MMTIWQLGVVREVVIASRKAVPPAKQVAWKQDDGTRAKTSTAKQSSGEQADESSLRTNEQ
jgi:hypothetical protein